jgi:acyl-ACP--UDP-N-acetylglucosamine O-acyltransferase
MAAHVTAIVDPSASIHESAQIGPYAIVGANVTIGARTTVGAHAVIEGPTTLGEDNRVAALAALGGPPQDLKYKGEPTTLVIGNRNTFREFCTVHRGTMTGHGTTVIGDDNLFMAYSHVAHDCVVGNRTVFANGASLAGHCAVGDDVVLGAFAGVRQFLRIGPHAFIGAFAGLNHDVLPFLWTSSERDVRAWKVNSVERARGGPAEGLPHPPQAPPRQGRPPRGPRCARRDVRGREAPARLHRELGAGNPRGMKTKRDLERKKAPGIS